MLAASALLVCTLHAPPMLRAPSRLHSAIIMVDSDEPERKSRNPLKGMRGLVVSTKNSFFGQGVGRDDEEAPAVLNEEFCLVPGSPVVRVESAPGNARRIFTGIDIVTTSDDVLELVWKTLTDYDNLADAVPNLVKNEVLSRTDSPRGARLKQLGAAKLAPGVTFTATTTLDVVEYFDGLPSSMEAEHLVEVADGAKAAKPGSIAWQSDYKDRTGGTLTATSEADDARPSSDSDAVRAYGEALPLTWNRFPRPYSVSNLPNRDITMQGVRDLGDFAFYQGVWRLQPLPGCAPPGSSAMRLTYSVELSPRLWVPVALLEGRIAAALAENLEAVRDFVIGIAEEEARLRA